MDQRRLLLLEPAVLDYIEGDDTMWEREPLERLARDNQLAAFRHRGYWKPMGYSTRSAGA